MTTAKIRAGNERLGEAMKGCKFCEAMEKKVKTNEQWDAEHAGHGGYTWEQAPHPSGTWFWKVCKCGHKHLRIREEAGK